MPKHLILIGWLTVILSGTLGGTVFARMNFDPVDGDDTNWVEGRKAIEAQDWPRAVALLVKAASADSANPDIYNCLGYAQRKSGHLPEAFAAYNQALRLDPAHKQTHEYIGEAYLLTGDVANAEQHLAALGLLCAPTPCEEYKDLRRAIEDYKNNKR
jgi:tetratricopeptide (TPR) repeat protein